VGWPTWPARSNRPLVKCGDGDGIEIDYRVTETEIQVELRGGGRTTRISAPRG